MVSVSLKFLSFFLIGVALYLLAVALAVAFRVFFPSVQFITVEGRNIDIVNYLILATFDFILYFLQIILSIVFVGIVWVWNGLVVNFFLHGLGNALNLNFLTAIQTVPESNLVLFVNAIESLRLLFVGFIGNFFGDISDGISGLFGGVL